MLEDKAAAPHTGSEPRFAGPDEDDQLVNAIRASGAIVHVEPDVFLAMLERAGDPLVVHATGGLIFSHERYLTSYKGLFFYTQSKTPLELPPGVEKMNARNIWIPH